MSESPVGCITEYSSSLEDPRLDRTKRRKLLDIIVIAICALICGADTWVDIELFGNAKLSWFQTSLDLPNGISSHEPFGAEPFRGSPQGEAFGRLFARLNPEQFQRCFLDWVQAVYRVTQGQLVAIDGKSLRRSHDGTLVKQPWRWSVSGLRPRPEARPEG